MVDIIEFLSDDEDDMELIQSLNKTEISLNETPLRKLNQLDIDSSKKSLTSEAKHDKNKNSAAKSLFVEDDEDDMLLANVDIESAVKETKIIESTSDNDEEDQDSNENQKYIKVLKNYWGFSSFRKLQLKIIKDTIENKRDQLVVMATGRGKSLCYQFPSIYLKGLTIVISPLISLMEDQVMSLKMLKVKACLISTIQKKSERDQNMIEALSGSFSIIYLTPEFIEINEDFILNLNKKVEITLVAVDECHCISQWGNDFRPAYRRLGNLRQVLKNAPFIALTATATPDVRKDILKSLYLINPITTVTSFDRPNLYLSVSIKLPTLLRDLRKFMIEDTEIKDKVRFKFNGSTIIYCQTKKMVDEITKELQETDVKAAAYHAGLKPEFRKKNQTDFINDEIDVIVATIAFGMGIDKPDIRNVLHYGAPKELESYYQEIGRAGRDGLPSKCHIFYQTADFNLTRFFIGELKSDQVKQFKEKMLIRIQKFLTARTCRRSLLLEHFNDSKGATEHNDNIQKGCCDNCTVNLESSAQSEKLKPKDFTEQAFNFLSSIKFLYHNYALGLIISFLIGSRNSSITKKLKDHQFKSEFFGSGKGKNENWWKAFSQQMMIEDYIVSKQIKITYGSYSILNLTKKGKEFLMNKQRVFKIFESDEMKQNAHTASHSSSGSSSTSSGTFDIKSLPPILPSIPVNQIISISNKAFDDASTKNENNSTSIHAELYKLLMVTRNELAEAYSCSAHNVCNNKVLAALASIRPSDTENLEKISDFPYAKIDTVGVKLLEKINSFCQKFKINMNNFSSSNSFANSSQIATPSSAKSNDSKIEEMIETMKPTQKEAYRKFQIENKTVEEIAAERGIAFSTVLNYLDVAILHGLPIDFNRLGVDMDMINSLEATIRQPPINSNISVKTSIKEQAGDLGWGHLSICLALLRRKYGISFGNDLDVKSTSSSSSVKSTASIRPFPQKSKSPETENVSLLKSKENQIVDSSDKTRQLPNWLKRSPSEHDIKGSTITKVEEKEKTKKKPKLNV